MRIALYRGKGIVSRLILWQSRGKFSHAAVVMADDSVIESREFKGVQKRAHFKPVEGQETVKIFDVSTTLTQEGMIMDFLNKQLGKSYDYLSILRFITREDTNRYTTNTWFCSELVFAAFQHAGINLLARIEPWAVSPGQLATSPLLNPL